MRATAPTLNQVATTDVLSHMANVAASTFNFQQPTHGVRADTFFADDSVVFVVRIVGVSEPSVRSEFKLKELVPELALVPNVIAHVKVIHVLMTAEHLQSRGWKTEFV